MKRTYIALLVVTAVLLIDQVLKFYVKLNFELNESILMGGFDWARVQFAENEGMAFSLSLGGTYGKLILSLFRIIMITGLIWYIRQAIRTLAPGGFIAALSLIVGGAIGNIIDSAIYGLIFTESIPGEGPAHLISGGETGYGTFLHGKVVDMLFFPIKDMHLPDWLPVWGGQNMLFFGAIFNIADAAITCGIMIILFFYSKYFTATHA